MKPEDLDLIKSWANDIEAVTHFNFFGYHSNQQIEKNFELKSALGEEKGGFMVINKEGEPLGDVSYRAVQHGPGVASRAYEIGIALLPLNRGQGYGVEAQKLLADYLFSITAVQRIQATTDIENKAEQRALEKAGFEREGVLRRCHFREGTWHDMVMYSRLRDS